MTQFTLSHFDKVVIGNTHLRLCLLFHPWVVSEVTLVIQHGMIPEGFMLAFLGAVGIHQ